MEALMPAALAAVVGSFLAGFLAGVSVRWLQRIRDVA